MNDFAEAWKQAAKNYRMQSKVGLKLSAFHIHELQRRVTELETENKRLKLKLSEFDLEGDYSE